MDIETAPYRTDEYASAFPKSKKKPGLHAIVSQVVAVGLCVDGHPSVIGWSEFGSEKAILERLAIALQQSSNYNMVGFNIRKFDIPVLRTRAVKYGLRLDLPNERSPRLTDIYEAMGGKWAADVSSCTLSELGWHLYGQGKATDGGDVARWFASGEFEKIEAHCLEDIVLTDRVFRDFRGALW